ncbi:hypothetical protein AJ88_15785 [Mesorhizobium amorphae CCBAU 01583]|nr:hypothetical protein AJ88_15785 [Mesorhizobium amorphae CCBAU 01583]
MIPRQDYGDHLARDAALAKDGPHGASGPGSLTRWMGTPWQTDEASCDSGRIYAPSLYLSTPSFWGARVPNQVLPAEAYAFAISSNVTTLHSQRHFSNRRPWLRDIHGRNYLERIDNMTWRWWHIGL